ncbi:MAG: F0F1 ATP synthase subunit delta [Treponema sp.]|nr:F0F1 ATP synthase subunit delta [Treponema sp.]
MRIDRWAEAFMLACKDASSQDVDTEFAILKTIVPVVGSVNGYIAGTTAAFLVEKKIHAALRKADIQGGEIACRTATLLVKKGLFKYASALVERIEAEIDIKNGVVRVNIETALPLDPAAKEKLLSAIMQRTDAKTVCSTEAVRPELLGGCRLTFGNTVVDASLSALLRDMEKKLSSGI